MDQGRWCGLAPRLQVREEALVGVMSGCLDRRPRLQSSAVYRPGSGRPHARRPKIFFMNQPPLSLVGTLRLLALAAALVMPAVALADDYAQVTQLMRAGKHADALAQAERYLVVRPRDPQMRFLRGVIQTESGRIAEAMATYTELVREYPELAEPYNNLAVLHAAQNDFEKAREALQMAIRVNPAYATAHANLGDVYVQLARQAYGRALALDPSNAAVRARLSQHPAPAPAPGRQP
jgi:tetratricopeptide (TPR) repeat protein